MTCILGRRDCRAYQGAECREPLADEPVGRGVGVETAEMSFSGLARLAAPAVAAYLPFLASKTVDQLRTCLDRQSDPGPLSA